MAKKQNKQSNKVITASSTTNRSFSYSKGSGEDLVNLNFTLRTDTKGQLKNFIECMTIAMKDVQAEIDKE